MPGPLEGIRVLDFGQYLAGPFGPMLLADLGADVIKVEPTRGDGMRPVVGPFLGCQRGKRDIAIDLKQPEGLRIALELVASADMVHHNMTLGTADRLGVGYQHCKAVRPDLLYCNNFMYGPVGPLARPGGLDPLGQAASGLEGEQGPGAAGNTPQWDRHGPGDVAAAMPAALAEAFLADHALKWRRALDAAGVPSEVSVDTCDGETVLFDDDLVRLGLVAEYEHPLLGRVRQFGNLITFSDTPGQPRRPAPMVGQHTREILAELGYDEAAIDGFRAHGIVSWPDDSYPYVV